MKCPVLLTKIEREATKLENADEYSITKRNMKEPAGLFNE